MSDYELLFLWYVFYSWYMAEKCQPSNEEQTGEGKQETLTPPDEKSEDRGDRTGETSDGKTDSTG